MKQWTRCVDCACSVVTQNPATLRLIGLCPLLAVSNTTIKACALGVLLGGVIVITAIITSVLRYCVSWRLKPMYHALIASFATVAAVACASISSYELIMALGIYPALIASNCLVLSFMQEVAERNSLARTASRALRDVVAVVVFLGLFGAVREIAAYGTMFTDIALIQAERPLGITSPSGPIPLLAQAPGALLTLAVMLAAANAITRRNAQQATNNLGSATASIKEPNDPILRRES